jgi:hypothetical protein
MLIQVISILEIQTLLHFTSKVCGVVEMDKPRIKMLFCGGKMPVPMATRFKP